MAHDDDLPVFRPRFGRARTGSAGSASNKSFRNAVLAAARRMTPGSGGARAPRSPNAARSRVPLPLPSAQSRRVVVKAHFVKMNAYGSAASRLHLAYLQREGVEKDGSKGVLYDADGLADPARFAKPLADEKHQFRVIVSPEDAGELDLSDFVRRYMARVEADLQQPLDWLAVNHFNTDNPHAHILIRGVDRQGEQVRFDRQYISHGLRLRAQELATEELGPRPEWQVERQRHREVHDDRLTGLDRELARLSDNGVVEVRAPRPRRVDENLLTGRLVHLESLGLAEREGPNRWRLADGWQQQLREIGKQGDIIAQMHQDLRADPGRYEILNPDRPPQDPHPVFARLVRKHVSDDRANSYSAVLETADGRGYYTPLSPTDAEKVREGDMVLLRWSSALPAGHSPPLPNPNPQSPGVRDRSAEISNPDAPPLPDGKREPKRAVSPQVRLFAQPLRLDDQIRYAGPVWLDRVKSSELAPYGFGAEVTEALAKREEVLRSYGIRSDDPHRASLLRDLELRTMAERRSREAAERFLQTPPSTFRGRVSFTERTPSGAQYAALSDGSSFVLVPLSSDLKDKLGKSVVVKRTRQGRLLVQAPDKDRER